MLKTISALPKNEALAVLALAGAPLRPSAPGEGTELTQKAIETLAEAGRRVQLSQRRINALRDGRIEDLSEDDSHAILAVLTESMAEIALKGVDRNAALERVKVTNTERFPLLADPSDSRKLPAGGESVRIAAADEVRTRLATAKWDLRVKILTFIIVLLALPGLGVAVASAALRTASGIANGPDFTFGHPSVAFFLHAGQASIIFLFVRWHRKWLRETKATLFEKAPDAPIAQETLRQFTIGWECMWYAWLLLYTWFTIAALTPLAKLPWVESVSDGCNVISSCAIWSCYLSLEVRSVKLATDQKRDRPFWKALAVVAVAGLACIVLSVIGRTTNSDLGIFGIVLSGIFSALALASFTGRLGSRYIGTPRWEIMLLYLYAMVQIFYPLLQVLNNELWIPAVFVSALLLKFVLFDAGYKMMKKGGLIRYLEAAESGLLNPKAFDDDRWKAVMKAAS